MQKDIYIVVAGSEGQQEYKDISVLPGTKPRDIFATLGLNGFQLSKPKGGFFGHNDDIYTDVETGQKLFATKADVVAGRA